MSAAETPYDQVAYLSGARASTHPDKLATGGRLLGLATAAPATSRVLEIGCGDGGNLIPIALGLPGAECIGIDVAPTAVARGAAFIEALGAGNVRLLAADIMSVGPELGSFDYIICHGVFSWVPLDVRTALLELVRDRLRPAGIAFVSYNAMPGNRLSQMLRDMMLFHTRAIPEPGQKIAQARALLALLALAPGGAGNAYRGLLASEATQATASSDFLLYHDDLAVPNDPYYFSDFIEMAGRAGLQFACEADLHDMSIASMPPELAAILGQMGQQDLLLKEQYLDFVTCRRFRQTLLCHAGAQLDRAVDAKRVEQFLFTTMARRAETEAGLEGETFRHPNGSVLRTTDTPTLAAMHALAGASPGRMSFDALAEAAGVADDAVRRAQLAEALFQAMSAGVISFSLFQPRWALDPGDQPVVSPWARLRAESGRVVTLDHQTIELDEADRALLPLLDGTRTNARIAELLHREEDAVLDSVRLLGRLGLCLA